MVIDRLPLDAIEQKVKECFPGYEVKDTSMKVDDLEAAL